jgi:hypothetical protein
MVLIVGGVLAWRMTAGSSTNHSGFSVQLTNDVTSFSSTGEGSLTVDFNLTSGAHSPSIAICQASSSGYTAATLVTHISRNATLSESISLTGGASSTSWELVPKSDVFVSCT